MKTVSLIRYFAGSHGTFGRMTLDGKAWWTVERPPTGDHPAIPIGTYGLTMGIHHAGKPDAYPCYWLQDVPGRSAIQIHIANLATQLEGCIAPGLTLDFVTVGGQKSLGVTSSGDAFKYFMLAMSGQPGTITITDQL